MSDGARLSGASGGVRPSGGVGQCAPLGLQHRPDLGVLGFLDEHREHLLEAPHDHPLGLARAPHLAEGALAERGQVGRGRDEPRRAAAVLAAALPKLSAM